MDFVLTNQISNRGVGISTSMIMTRPRASAAATRIDKGFPQHHGKLRANLWLLVCREYVHDTRDRRDRGISMQGRKG